MYYKCYYHPKKDGCDTCKGCMLPVCEGCQGEMGFCPECTRKRDAVSQLRQLRNVVSAKTRVSGSTTARLRLAIRQVGPGARRSGAKPPAAAGTRIHTGVLDAAPLGEAWQADAMAADGHRPREMRDARAHGNAGWTYDPGRVAYQPVGGPTKKRAMRTAGGRPLAPMVPRAPQHEATQKRRSHVLAPFIIGLCIGLIIVVGLMFRQSVDKFEAPVPKAKPLYTQLTTSELKFIRSTTQNRMPVRKATRAVAKPHGFAEAVAEANQAAAAITARTRVPADIRFATGAPVRSATYRSSYGVSRAAVRRSAPAYGGARVARFGSHKPSLAESMRFSSMPAASRGSRGNNSGIAVTSW